MNKILLVSRIFPPEVGGSGRWLWELYSRFPRGEVVVVAHASTGSHEFDATHDMPIKRIPLSMESWGVLNWHCGTAYLRLYRTLAKLAYEQSVSEIHAACVLPEGFLAWLLWQRRGLPYRLYVHGEELGFVSKSGELSWLATHILRDAKQVVANSHNTANLLLEGWAIDPRRVVVLHPGVETDVYCPAPRDIVTRRRLGWGDRPVVLTVGRLQQRKGQDNFIRSIVETRRAVPDVLYSIVGDGTDRERLVGLVDELQLHNHVKIQGELRNADLVAAYQQCDLFALANREVQGDIEGFGLVLLEAQACGKPVLTGNSGGTRETINAPETGVLLNGASVAQIAAETVRLLTDTERMSAMGFAARDWTCQNFDWSVCVERARQAFGLSNARAAVVSEKEFVG
jgi:phosphatidylinositol alpha-1,6-mannosyltransferase